MAFAAVLGLYALQALYSIDREQALKNVCLFYVPFAVLCVLLLDGALDAAAAAAVVRG